MTEYTPDALRIGRYDVAIRHAPDRGELGLSGREWDVLIHLMNGFATPAIAKKIGVSPHTVDTYRRRIYDKLEVDSAASASALCMAFQIGATITDTE